MKILGIETSCDETALALFENEKLLYSKVSSHIVHKNYGGVVPELASREHDKILPQLYKDCFKSVDFSKWKSSVKFYPIQVETPIDIIKWMDLSPQNIELIVTKTIE